MVIDVNPEFGVELVLAVPYAFWLHNEGKLSGVRTTIGMKPFYYFCDNVEEVYDSRTIDNGASKIDSLPNDWIHHNSMAVMGKEYSELTPEEKVDVNGVLDYTQWMSPHYLTHFKTDEFDKYGPYVVICNKYTIEHGQPPAGYFDIQCLYDMFEYFQSIGHTVIYKRPKNTEFPVDQNDKQAAMLGLDLTANVKGVGVINDFQLTEYFENVILMDDIMDSDYNTFQMRLFSSATGFVTPSGGGSILCSCFGSKVVIYATHSGELRPGYLTGDNSYYKKLSGADIYPVYDPVNNIKTRGNDYTELLSTIKDVFNE